MNRYGYFMGQDRKPMKALEQLICFVNPASLPLMDALTLRNYLNSKLYLFHLSWSNLSFSAILNSVCKSLKTACRAGAIGLLAAT